MPNRRAQIAMDSSEVESFLAGGRSLVLTSIEPDGVPHPAPMWYVLDDAGRPLMRTYTRSRKVANLRRDPRAVGLVEDGARYAELRGVQLVGRIEFFDDVEAILDVITGLAVKYEGLSGEQAAQLREAARPKAEKQVGLRLVPERVVSWDHRKLGGGY